MEVLAKQTADGRSRESEKEELQSSLNRMIDAASSWKRERAQHILPCR